jgi:putative intracellular protease/amidase
VFTVAENAEPITTAMGMRVVPHYTLGDHPEPDVLLTPGGGVDHYLDNAAIISWIQRQEKVADYVLSVCNGAFFLAKAGLLDGKSATTYYGLLDEFENLATKTTVVNDKRFVDNGKIITSAGLSAGMDASLLLVSKIRGMGRAQAIALNMEYNWQPEVEFARSVLADYKYLRDLNVFAGLETELLYSRGTTSNWRQEWRVKIQSSAKELLAHIDKKLQPFVEWKKVDGVNGEPNMSNWQMTGEDGEPWSGKVAVEPMPGTSGEYEVSLEIARVDHQTRR